MAQPLILARRRCVLLKFWNPWRVAVTLAVVSLLSSALLMACSGGKDEGAALADASLRPDPTAPIVVPSGAPIVIGISAPLTGPDGAAGTEDKDAVIAGAQRWKAANGRQIKGHEIAIRAEDDGCTEADITVQAAEHLLRREGLVGVLGPDCSAGAAAAIPIYARAGIVAISGSATRTDLATMQPEGKFFFRTAYRNDLEGLLIGLFLSSGLQAQSGWLIDDGEPYGQDLAEAAGRVAMGNGVRIVRETVPRGTEDFSQLTARIAQDNPDFVGFAGFTREAALFYRQLRHAGYTGVFGSVDAAASVPGFVEPVGPEAEGVLFAGCSLALPQGFLVEFRKLHGHEPEATAFVAQYADAATILLDAVMKVAQEQADGSLTIDPIALRDAVRATSVEDGISGSFAFDANGDRVPHSGDVLSEFVAAAIKNGDTGVFVELGLVPCQVQDGKLVNLLGPGAQPRR